MTPQVVAALLSGLEKTAFHNPATLITKNPLTRVKEVMKSVVKPPKPNMGAVQPVKAPRLLKTPATATPMKVKAPSLAPPKPPDPTVLKKPQGVKGTTPGM